MCGPAAVVLPIISSVGSIGLGIYGAHAQQQQAEAAASVQYEQQQAMSFAQWSQQELNMQFQYDNAVLQAETSFMNQQNAQEFNYLNQQLAYDARQKENQRMFEFREAQNQLNYDQQMAQLKEQQAYEQLKADSQQWVMDANRELSGIAYMNDIRQIDLRLRQEEAAAIAKKLEGARETAKLKAAATATGRQGNTVLNLLVDYERQQNFYDFAVGQNLAFSGMGAQEAKRGAAATYGARLASETPYIKRGFVEPQKQLNYLEGAGPSPMRGPDPIKGRVTRGIAVKSPVMKSYVPNNFALNAATAVVGGIGNVATSFHNYGVFKKTGQVGGPGWIGPGRT